MNKKINSNELLYKLKDNKNSTEKESFNRYLYDVKKDCGEYNSGVYMVDSTGYIELATLITKCHGSISNPEWQTDNCGVDKFTDEMEIALKVNENLSVAKTKQKEAEEIQKKIKEEEEKLKIINEYEANKNNDKAKVN